MFIKFGITLYRRILGIPLDTDCDPLVVDLYSFCNEGDFMLSLSDNNEAHVVEAFNSTSRCTVNIESTTRVLLVFHTKIPTFYKCFQSKQLCFVYVSSFIVGKAIFFTRWERLFENMFYIIE